jgi:hypothetical protein
VSHALFPLTAALTRGPRSVRPRLTQNSSLENVGKPSVFSGCS